MLPKRIVVRLALALAFLTLVSLTPTPVSAGGPISEMLARRKMQRQMKIPPMDQPFSTKPVRDISPSNLSNRFRQRFSLKKPDGSSILSGGFFAPKDQGVARTSR
ncbi:hypothetical protein P12x_001107 [Tundrisphaera lichenicola]|uniref:hypothetical protein n=1 Tax=Tundrisphaera lichenicola TaxID=2029860 RepID=UPI003EB79EF4